VTVDRNDTDGVIFYFDGVEVGSGDATQRPGSLSTTAGLALASNSGAIGVLLDEIEIFEREIDENDIGAIALAGSAGKCSERCTLPHVLSYCANQTQKTATLLVCNDSSVSHDFSVEFLRLAGRNPQTGQGCNVDGPADFTPSQANVTVAGGDCEEVTVQIDAPASFAVDTPGQSGCYLAQIVNLDTGSCESCRGMVRQIPQDFACAVPQQGGAATALSKTGITPVQFELENLSVAPVSIDYSIRSLPPDGDPTDPHLALDGLGVFDQVNGSTTLPAGQTDSVQVDVSVDRFQGFGLEQLLLSADVDGDGVYEAIGSRTLAPHPAPEPGVILQLVAGGVGLAFLNKRRLQKNRRAKPTS